MDISMGICHMLSNLKTPCFLLHTIIHACFCWFQKMFPLYTHTQIVIYTHVSNSPFSPQVPSSFLPYLLRWKDNLILLIMPHASKEPTDLSGFEGEVTRDINGQVNELFPSSENLFTFEDILSFSQLLSNILHYHIHSFSSWATPLMHIEPCNRYSFTFQP